MNCVNLPADTLTPLSVFLRLREKGANVLLESLEEGRYWGRFSFIGFGRRKLLFPKAHEKAWEELRRFLKEEKNAPLQQILPFQGGLVGHFCYDLIENLEPVPLPEKSLFPLPQMAFLVVEDIIGFDNLRGELFAISKNKETLKEILSGLKSRREDPLNEERSEEKPLSSFTKEEFLKAVEEVRELILSGEAIQVVLGQMFKVRSPRDPFSVYRHLRRINPSPYLFFIDFDSYALLGSSPEVMVRLKDGKLKTKPIAGTRPRTGDPQRDKELVEELLKDPKEAAEHVMLVDLARNDLGRVSKIGSVKVTRFKTVEAYSHVFHLVSEVEGELKEGCDALDVIKATFPAGTLSGAPKVRAMQIISEKEPVRRGFYGGAVGYLDFNGNADTAIAIRCVLYKDGVYYLGAGAGIVADSMPEREYEECLHKASALFEALGVTRP
jgi:anthranilate synthase component 1